MLKITKSSDVLASRKNNSNNKIVRFGISGGVDRSLNQKID